MLIYKYLSDSLIDIFHSSTNPLISSTKCNKTIMFIDKRNFTKDTQSLSLENLLNQLNEHIEKVSIIIKPYGGKIDKFLGDKIELNIGGYSGLNYENLVEHGWRAWLKVEIIKIDKNLLEPYLVRLPDNTTIRISDKDIKGA